MDDIEKLEKAKKLKSELKGMQARFRGLINDPETIDIICAHVAGGGTMVHLAEIWDVRYADLSNWINKDSELTKRYNAALRDRGEWTSESVLKELRNIGMSDIRKIWNENGSLKPMSDWPEETARSIASVEVDELFEGTGKDRMQVGFTKKVKFWDKTKGLEMIGKNLKLFVDPVDKLVDTLEALVVGSNEKDVTNTDESVGQKNLPAAPDPVGNEDVSDLSDVFQSNADQSPGVSQQILPGDGTGSAKDGKIIDAEFWDDNNS